MKKGIFFTHQGWTDIINCLGLIGHYSKSYEKLVILVREDSKPFMDFYLNQFNNVYPQYEKKENLDNYHFVIPDGYDILFHGYHDQFRKDQYKLSFHSSRGFFVKKFYEAYGITFETKIEDFSLVRDFELENIAYKNFIKSLDGDYILYHEDKYTPGGFTGIELPKNIIESEKSINLNLITDNFFIYSEILQKSKEIHLVDSVWASVIYLIDCKYKLFENIPIFIYPFRSREGGLLNYANDKNIEPKHPDNWIIKKV